MPNNLLTMDLKKGHAEYGTNHPVLRLKTKASAANVQYSLKWLTVAPFEICAQADEISMVNNILRFIVDYDGWASDESESRMIFAVLLRTFDEPNAVEQIVSWLITSKTVYCGKGSIVLWQILSEFCSARVKEQPLEADFINQWRDHPEVPACEKEKIAWLEDCIWAERENYRTNMLESGSNEVYVSSLQNFFVDEMCEFLTGNGYLQETCSEEDLETIQSLVILREFVPAVIAWMPFARNIDIFGDGTWPAQIISDFCGSGIVQEVIKRLD